MSGSATPAVAARYIHPQGSIITVYDNGAIVKVNPAGKVVATSATAEKLARGHGGWTLIAGDDTPVATPLPAQKAAPSRTLLPMKFKEAPIADLKRFVVDDDWVLQQKLDGIRAMLVFEPGNAPWFRNGTGGVLASDTARPVADAILRLLPTDLDVNPGASIDGEVIDGKFWAFDVIVDGHERDPLSGRLDVLTFWHEGFSGPLADKVRLLPTARTMDEKHKLAEAVHSQGGEGWIAKRLDGAYNWGARVEHSLKVKITHTIDCVVVDKNRAGKSNYILGLNDPQLGEVVEVGQASAIGKLFAEVGDILEVKYLYASTAERRLTQPTILRRRDDKQAQDCTTDQLRFACKEVVLGA